MMEILFVAMIVYGSAEAVHHGSRAAGRAVSGFYRRRVQSWQGQTPGRFRVAGAHTGATLATAGVGGFLAAGGFLSNLRAGWRHGAQRARDRRGTPSVPIPLPPRSTIDNPEPVSVPTLTLVSGPPADPPPIITESHTGPCAESSCSEAWRSWPPNRLSPREGEPVMGMATMTSGEVGSIPEVLREFDQSAALAGGEVPDVALLAKRAEEEMRRWELIAAGMAGMNMGPKDLAAAARMLELATVRFQSAQQMLSATDAMNGAAQAEKKALFDRHRLGLEAAASQEHLADRQAYIGG